MILSLNIYPILLIGWSSRNKFSIIGALRGVAQTISYEIRLALIVLIILIYLRLLDLSSLTKFKAYYKFFFMVPPIFYLWVVSRLAETNRTPFDFSEGERELVSGFNTEFRAVRFALIFMAEYGRIYFLRAITALVFYWGTTWFIIRFIIVRIVFTWIWVRATFPRYRYDLLIRLAWKRILPAVLRIVLFIISVRIN